MDRFKVGKDCKCPNTNRYHFLRYKGIAYAMYPRKNGVYNKEFEAVRKLFMLNSFKINDMLEEIHKNYTSWEVM